MGSRTLRRPRLTIKAFARNTAKKATSHVHYSSGSIKTPYSHEPARTAAYLLALQGLGQTGCAAVPPERAGHCQRDHRTLDHGTVHHGHPVPRMFFPSAQSLPRTMIAESAADRQGHMVG